MTKSERELWKWIQLRLEDIQDEIKDWEDEERTYTPAERQLAVRLDRRIVPM